MAAVAALSTPGVLLSREVECARPWLPVRHRFGGIASFLLHEDGRWLCSVSRGVLLAAPAELKSALRAALRELLAVGGDDGVLRVLDPSARAGAEVRHPAPISVVSWSPSGHRVATGCDDGRLRLVDPETVKIDWEVRHDGRVGYIDWSPNGQHLVTGCETDDLALRFVDVASGKVEQQVALGYPLGALLWSPRSSLVAACAEPWMHIADRRVCFVNSADGAVNYLDNGSPLAALAWSPSGTLLATGAGDKKLRVLDPTARTVLSSVLHGGRVRFLAWSPSDEQPRVATGCDAGDSCIRIIDAITGAVLHVLDQWCIPCALAWGRSGRWLATGTRYNSQLGCSTKPAIRIFDATSGKLHREVCHTGTAARLAWDPDGERLAWAGMGGAHRRLQVVCVETGTVEQDICYEEDMVQHAPSWSPHGQRLACVLAGEGPAERLLIVYSRTAARRGVCHSSAQEGARQFLEPLRTIAWRP